MTLRIFWRIAIHLASHSARRHVSDENLRQGRAAAESSRMLLVVASVPALSFPPPPGSLPLGFHRGELSLGDGKVADRRGKVAATVETC
jgi:hypothetical protein